MQNLQMFPEMEACARLREIKIMAKKINQNFEPYYELKDLNHNCMIEIIILTQICGAYC